MEASNIISLIAPAKVNLFLHVTGKREDGYHELQSLVAFANFGDKITITPAERFSFSFDSTSKNMPTDESNIIICAANLLAAELNKNLNCHIHLTKSIPIGAGLGGGSSDAAAVIEGLLKFWKADIGKDQLDKILIELGADVPVCFYKNPCYFEGVGEIITPIKALPSLPALLIYPNTHCSTQDIFKSYNVNFSKNINLPKNFDDEKTFLEFLRTQRNDLTNTALEKISDIKDILNALDSQENCLLSRMSGSGSACFGLFSSAKEAHNAALKIQEENSSWWVQAVTLK